MLLSVFEKYIFLQSLGWGIANSLWQSALLFVIYHFVIRTSNRTSSLFRYHFSLVLLFASFTWFVSTIVQNYFAAIIKGSQASVWHWMQVSENFSRSLQWMSVAYIILLGVHLVLFLQKLHGLFSIKNSGFVKTPVTIRLFTEQTALQLGIHKKVSIWLSEKTSVPSVIGFFKPIILLPFSALNHLSTTQVEAVILHELAHIRRNDYLLNFVQCCIEIILFFNPFAKMLGNTARIERENCCDDWVLNFQYNKQDYAAALLKLEQNRFSSVQFALAATNGKKRLLLRVKRLFYSEPSVYFSFMQKCKLLAITFTILSAALFVLPVTSKKTSTKASNLQGIILPAAETKITVAKTNTGKVKTTGTNQKLTKAASKSTSTGNKSSVDDLRDTPDEIMYNTALINEELLQQNASIQSQEKLIPVANIEMGAQHKVYIKVEEEKNGTNDKRIYYIEANNNNGAPAIKPLVIINKKAKENPAKNKIKSYKLKTVKNRTTT